MQSKKKIGILACICILVLTMGTLVGCSGTDDEADTDTTYESSTDTDIYDTEDDYAEDDLQEDTSTTDDEWVDDAEMSDDEQKQDEYSLDSSIFDDSYLSSDDESLLDSTEDSGDTE